LAQSYEESHFHEQARRYYEQVCESGFYPEAWVGLAAIAQENKEHSQAREALRAALDVTREPGPEAEKPLALLGDICRKLAAMNAPVEGCAAWIAHMDLTASPASVRRLSLLVCDTHPEDAREQVRWLYAAMHPGEELPDSRVVWEPAGQENTPRGAIAPGIYGHWFE
jgi:hypothetical protein